MIRDEADGSTPADRALGIAERLLTRRYGATVRLANPEDLGGSGRSVVVRASVVTNPFSLPRTLVVKHHLRDPEPSKPDPFRYEVASCQLFNALAEDSRPSPVLFAHDPQLRVLVLEDLGRSSTLADKLFGPSAASAERCLISWAAALGRMHASTASRENDFGALLRRLGERSWRDPVADDARAALAGLPELLAGELQVRVGAVAAEQARATARLLGGTRYRAFSPSDTCPDNNLVTSRGVRFVDFEAGCFRDVALDAAYFRVPFPACEASFALPPRVAEDMLGAWRAEVVGVWPDLRDTELLARRMLDAQLLWVWLCTWWLLPGVLRRNAPIGPTAARSPRAGSALVAYWRRLGLDAAAGGLDATAELATELADTLRARLDDGAAELPRYPAFRGLGAADPPP